MLRDLAMDAWPRAVVLFGAVYLVVGVTFPNPPAPDAAQFLWRLASWLTCAVAFTIHIALERFRFRSSLRDAGFHVALAVAIGAFALAAAANLHALTSGTGNMRRLALALVIWPVMTGVPAFLAGWLVAAGLARVPPRRTSEWTLWVIAASCALHVTEEYFTGWQPWAAETLGIVMPTPLFLLANGVLVAAALSLASVGWKAPRLSLIIPAATLVNAIFFHILPAILQRRVSPGLYTATLLYLPFSSWAFVGAWRDGIPLRTLAVAFTAGTLMMLAVVLAARTG
jgi:hypothetical protein